MSNNSNIVIAPTKMKSIETETNKEIRNILLVRIKSSKDLNYMIASSNKYKS